MKRGQSSKDGEDPLTKESLGILLKRGLQNIDESYFSFSRDLRHKCPSLNSFSPEQAEQFARNIKCPHLVIKANNGVYEDKESVAQALNCYQKNPKFEMVNVKGTKEDQNSGDNDIGLPKAQLDTKPLSNASSLHGD